MKVLWNCNVAPSIIRKHLKNRVELSGGWLDTLSEKVYDSVEYFIIVIPGNYREKSVKKTIINEHLWFYEIPARRINRKSVRYYEEILEHENPDIIHQFGTEAIMSSLLYKAISDDLIMQQKYIVTIQGVIQYISNQFGKDIDLFYKIIPTLTGVAKGNDILLRKKKYILQSYYEERMLKDAKCVIGRTELDHAFSVKCGCREYIKCGETLRNVFYEGKWDLDKCEVHSLFSSTNAGPIKGLHYLIEAFELISKKYSDAHLYLTGRNLFDVPLLALNNYDLYIRHLIKKKDLTSKITFLGALSADSVKEQMCKSNVVVISSNAENSSNFMGEALLLGAPCIVSDVGGAKEYIEHRNNGYVYQYDVPTLLSFYIDKVFSDKNEALRISENARITSRIHYSTSNIDKVLCIYNSLVGEKNEIAGD